MTLSVPVKTEQLNMFSEYSTTSGCVLYMSFFAGLYWQGLFRPIFHLFKTFIAKIFYNVKITSNVLRTCSHTTFRSLSPFLNMSVAGLPKITAQSNEPYHV